MPLTGSMVSEEQGSSVSLLSTIDLLQLSIIGQLLPSVSALTRVS